MKEGSWSEAGSGVVGMEREGAELGNLDRSGIRCPYRKLQEVKLTLLLQTMTVNQTVLSSHSYGCLDLHGGCGGDSVFAVCLIDRLPVLN